MAQITQSLSSGLPQPQQANNNWTTTGNGFFIAMSIEFSAVFVVVVGSLHSPDSFVIISVIIICKLFAHVFSLFLFLFFWFVSNNIFNFCVVFSLFSFRTGAVAILHSCSCEKRLIEYAVSVLRTKPFVFPLDTPLDLLRYIHICKAFQSFLSFAKLALVLR